MKQYDITVKIRVTVDAGGGRIEDEWADYIAKSYAEMALKYKSIGADEGLAQVTMKVEWPSYHIKKHFGVEE